MKTNKSTPSKYLKKKLKKISKTLYRRLKRWTKRAYNSFMKNLPESIISLIVAPIFIYTMMETIMDFSLFATLGYVFFCLQRLDIIFRDVRKPIIWGVGYIVGSIAFGLIFTYVIPLFSKGDSASIFSALIIGLVIGSIFLKSKEIKRIR